MHLNRRQAVNASDVPGTDRIERMDGIAVRRERESRINPGDGDLTIVGPEPGGEVNCSCAKFKAVYRIGPVDRAVLNAKGRRIFSRRTKPQQPTASRDFR